MRVVIWSSARPGYSHCVFIFLTKDAFSRCYPGQSGMVKRSFAVLYSQWQNLLLHKWKAEKYLWDLQSFCGRGRLVQKIIHMLLQLYLGSSCSRQIISWLLCILKITYQTNHNLKAFHLFFASEAVKHHLVLLYFLNVMWWIWQTYFWRITQT